MKTYEGRLDELADLVTKIAWTKKILQGLFVPYPQYVGTRLHHRELFSVFHDSQISYFCTSTAVLFWQKDQYEGLENLIDDLETKRGNPSLATILRDRIAAEQATIEKFVNMRHQHFGHRVMAKTSTQVWQEMNITLQDMEKVIDVAKFVIIELAKEAGNPDPLNGVFNGGTNGKIENDTKRFWIVFIPKLFEIQRVTLFLLQIFEVVECHLQTFRSVHAFYT